MMYRLSLFLFIIANTICAILYYFDISNFAIFLIPHIFFFALITYGTFSINSQFYTKTLCKIKTEEGIFLTFDDGPQEIYTPLILDILKKYQIKALFFVVGERALNNPEIIKRIADDGHIIGNHTLSHSNYFAFFNAKKVRAEIEETNRIIRKITLCDTIFFRPPVGILNPVIAKVCKRLEMKIIGWSLRSLDTVKSPQKVLKRLKKAQSGDIVLLHDNREKTPEILDEFLRFAKKNNYNFVNSEISL